MRLLSPLHKVSRALVHFQPLFGKQIIQLLEVFRETLEHFLLLRSYLLKSAMNNFLVSCRAALYAERVREKSNVLAKFIDLLMVLYLELLDLEAPFSQSSIQKGRGLNTR